MACRNKIRASVDGLNKIPSSYISPQNTFISSLDYICAEKLSGDVTRIAFVVVVIIISLLCNAIQVGDQPLKTVKGFNPLQVVGTGEEQFKSFLFAMKNENKRNFQILRVQIPNWQHTQSVSQWESGREIHWNKFKTFKRIQFQLQLQSPTTTIIGWWSFEAGIKTRNSWSYSVSYNGPQLIGRHVVVCKIYKYIQANLIDNLCHKFSIYFPKNFPAAAFVREPNRTPSCGQSIK